MSTTTVGLNSRKETHAENEQQVGQHTSQQRSLNESELILSESRDGDDEFDGVAEANTINLTPRPGDAHVALSKPPIVCPVLMDNCSVASPSNYSSS